MADTLIWTGAQWVSLRGPAGADGVAGADGQPGQDGPEGPQGPKGDRGDAGETGSEGPQGPKGDKGDTGEAGSGVTIQGTATTYPPSASPAQGDMFLVGDPVPPGTPASTTGPAQPGDGIGWDGVGTWVNVGPVRGPKGDTGPAGADGADGADGVAGADGAAGPAGADGADGADGENNEVYVQVAEPTAKRPGAIWIDIS